MFKFKTMAKMKFVSRIGIGISTLAISILLLFSYYGQQTGDFTIDVNQKLFLDKKMILSETVDFNTKSSRLVARPIGNVLPIGYYGRPEKIPLEIEGNLDNFFSGSNNGLNYFAYTFYATNSGEADFSYNLAIYIDEAQNNVDAAIRIMIIVEEDILGENKKTVDVYAKAQGSNGKNPGLAEIGTKMFASNKKVLDTNRYDFKMNSIDKYTVIMWLHGEDVDCVDIGENSIVAGSLKVSMKFGVIDL